MPGASNTGADPRAWTAVATGEQFVLARAWRALVRPYLPVLAAIVAWYPVVFLAVLPRVGSATRSTNLTLALILVPMLVLALTLRKLGGERRRIVVARAAGTLQLARREVPLADLARVLVLGSSRGHGTVGVVFRRAEGDAFLELVTIRDGANAATIATQLAGWLGLEVELDPPSLAGRG